MRRRISVVIETGYDAHPSNLPAKESVMQKFAAELPKLLDKSQELNSYSVVSITVD